MSKLREPVNFRETFPVTANKVRFQHMNTLKLFTLWLIMVAKRNKLITSYYEVEGIGNAKQQRKYNRTRKDTHKCCVTCEHEGGKN